MLRLRLRLRLKLRMGICLWQREGRGREGRNLWGRGLLLRGLSAIKIMVGVWAFYNDYKSVTTLSVLSVIALDILSVMISYYPIFYLYNCKEMDWVNHLTKINNKLKFQLFAKNLQTLDTFYSSIAQFDPTSSGCMSPYTFNLYLNSGGVFLSTQQIRTILDTYPQGHQIRFLDFIQNVRHDITGKRRAVIDHAFDQLSVNGVVEIQGLMSRFKADQHPHVRCMNKTAQRVIEETRKGLLQRSADGKHLNKTQFQERFLDLNACIPLEREEFYVDIVINSFGLVDQRVTIEHVKQLEVTVYEKVRQRTYLKKDQGLKSHSAFKFIDLQQTGLVNFQRFVSVLQRLGCKFTQKQNRALFEKHSSQPNLMNYEDMCGLMFEMGSGKKENSNPIYEMAKVSGYVTTPGMSKALH